ncbi:MAG: alpha/beta hydrolase family protein [Rehaibacterium terrae]|uniref:alpha/beta hydrolase family protein n=1 Tax=Rehaibacterium terrae TaxID=1341696 RepID=UPI00391C5B13
MTRASWTVALAACALILAPRAADARTPIPIETLAEAPRIQSISMSTDGKNIVAVLGMPGTGALETSLATWQLDDLDKGPTITASGDRMKFIAATAMKADRIFVVARQEWTGELAGCGEGKTTGNTKTFVTKAYLTDTSHKSFAEAFADNTRKLGISQATQRCLELAGTARLVSGLPLDPENVVIAQLDTLSFRDHYYLYNLRTNETRLLFRAGGRTQPGMFDPRTGEVLVRTQIEPVGGDFEMRIFIRNPDSGQFEQHDGLTTRLSERYTLNFVGIDEASGKYYILTDLFSDRLQAHVYDPKIRQFDPEPLVAHPELPVSGLILGSRPSDFNRVLGFTVSGMVTQTVWVDPNLRAIHEGLKQAFPGQSVNILNYTDDRSKLLFATESPKHPPTYHLLLDGKRVATLGSERPGIDPDSIGEQRWVTYPARDGLQIPAILDLPAGWSKEQGPLPTVIHPHGGPWSRDFGDWDATGWVPFFTSRGFAVLRPQYRGSAGLGRQLWLAGDAEWGQKMQDDKDDGARWLVEQGIADPKRLVIFGYSYGGFAAAAAVVRPDSPYRCAISGAPVTDLARLSNRWGESRLQRILQGRTVKGMDPMRNTDKANIPVLLYVGDRDVRTPAFHARDFYNAVKGKVPARFELIPDMPHSLPWYPRHQKQTLSLIESFLGSECGLNGAGS